VKLAARGTCILDTTEEQVEDQTLRDALRQQARGIQLKSIILAFLFTAAVVLIAA
jgi:hypothetical protein